MHKLSVLLPNYNNGQYLEACFDSLMNQTFQDFHIYFIDDCSTDNSIEILSKYPKEKYTLIQLSEQSGIVGALNAGLSQIESEYLIRMDGDDYCSLDRFEKLVSFMDEHQNYNICGSAIQAFGLRNDLRIYPKNPQMNHANLIFGHSIGHATSIFRTSIFKNNEISYLNDYYRLEDYQLFYRLKDFALMTSIPDALYFYRQEDYNVNEEIKARKTLAYEQFYAMVLEDVLKQVTKRDVELHLQLANTKTPIFEIKEYQAHVNKLLASNLKSKIFPQNELEIVLKGKLKQLKYILIDQNKIGVGQLIKYGFKDVALLKYGIKKRLKN